MTNRELVLEATLSRLLRSADRVLPFIEDALPRHIFKSEIGKAASSLPISPMPDPALTETERAVLNAQTLFPIGAPVRFYPWADSSAHIDSRVRSLPWALGHGAVVLAIEGKAGDVSIDHLELI